MWWLPFFCFFFLFNWLNTSYGLWDFPAVQYKRYHSVYGSITLDACTFVLCTTLCQTSIQNSIILWVSVTHLAPLLLAEIQTTILNPLCAVNHIRQVVRDGKFQFPAIALANRLFYEAVSKAAALEVKINLFTFTADFWEFYRRLFASFLYAY